MTDFEEKLKKMYQGIHAGLLKQAKELQEERAAVLQQAAAIEQMFSLKNNASVKLEHVPTASYAGITESAGTD